MPAVTVIVCVRKKPNAKRELMLESDTHTVASKAEPPSIPHAVTPVCPKFAPLITCVGAACRCVAAVMGVFAGCVSVTAGASYVTASDTVPISTPAVTEIARVLIIPADVRQRVELSDTHTVVSAAVPCTFDAGE